MSNETIYFLIQISAVVLFFSLVLLAYTNRKSINQHLSNRIDQFMGNGLYVSQNVNQVRVVEVLGKRTIIDQKASWALLSDDKSMEGVCLGNSIVIYNHDPVSDILRKAAMVKDDLEIFKSCLKVKMNDLGQLSTRSKQNSLCALELQRKYKAFFDILKEAFNDSSLVVNESILNYKQSIIGKDAVKQYIVGNKPVHIIDKLYNELGIAVYKSNDQFMFQIDDVKLAI